MAKVLVVDDSNAIRQQVGEFLRGNNIETITAVDGLDGLAKLQSDPNIKLILCDMNMPNMDGLTMVEAIRNELGNHAVNIIMLTADVTPAMKERARLAQVRSWIIKPFRGEGIIPMISEFLE